MVYLSVVHRFEPMIILSYNLLIKSVTCTEEHRSIDDNHCEFDLIVEN